MRSFRQSELAEFFPEHVVAAWLGNSPAGTRTRRLHVTDTHFRQARNESRLSKNPTGQDDGNGNAGKIERRSFAPWLETQTRQHGDERAPRIAHPCLRPESSLP